MKALTVWQPWASLIALGVKTIETRGWSTKYRGPLAIHAAARQPDKIVVGGYEAWPKDGRGEQHPNHAGPRPPRLYRNDGRTLEMGRWMELPLGAVVCIANLVDVLPITDNCNPGDPDCVVAGDDWLDLCLKGDNPRNGDLVPPGAHYIRDVRDQLPLGDFTPGRYAWLFADDVEYLNPPNPAVGRQGMWNYDHPVMRPAVTR